jgi:hypothetical protein
MDDPLEETIRFSDLTEIAEIEGQGGTHNMVAR